MLECFRVIESASGGMPGWIQNFVISLVQCGALTVVTIPRCDALAAGAVMPSPGLLQLPDCELQPQEDSTRESYQVLRTIL